MRLLYLTAGAAEMYCGSCLRDNALATALKARGHDVLLAPVYTPTTTDEKNVSEGHVLFGGVSVYLEQNVALFRHTPAFLDRLWDSNAVLRLASKKQIKVDPTTLGAMTVSMLKGTEGNQRKEIQKMLRWLKDLPKFDAISLPFALLIGLARPLRDAFNVPIVCTLQGEDLFLDQLPEPWRAQSMDLIKRSIGDVDVFIAVSEYYVSVMSKYLSIPKDRIRVVPLGINMDGHASKPVRTTPPFTVGFFGRIAPEKGLHVLAEAYRRLRARQGVPTTRLLAAGYMLDEHRDYFAGVQRDLRGWGLAGEFTYAGAPDRAGKIALLQSMDVFSMPATYAEPKGFTLIEAMANGVPIVQPDHGAFTEIVRNTGGGLLVPPGDVDALTDALFTLLTDREKASVLGRGGAEAVRQLYTAERMAERAEHVYAEAIRVSEAGPSGPAASRG